MPQNSLKCGTSSAATLEIHSGASVTSRVARCGGRVERRMSWSLTAFFELKELAI